MRKSAAKITHKHYRLDERKIKRAQKVLGAKTETETIERALDKIVDEAEKNRRAREAFDRFARSGAEIVDVYGRLENR